MKVLIDSFQVGALYFINESGYEPSIVSIRGVPAEDIVEPGYYEQHGYWVETKEPYDEDPNVAEAFKAWLDNQGVGYSERDGIVYPDHAMPNNPIPVYDCVYSDGTGEKSEDIVYGNEPSDIPVSSNLSEDFDGEVQLVDKSTGEAVGNKAVEVMEQLVHAADIHYEEYGSVSIPSNEYVTLDGEMYRINHLLGKTLIDSNFLVQFEKACKSDFDQFWNNLGDKFDIMIDALDERRTGAEYILWADDTVVPISEIFDNDGMLAFKNDLRNAIVAYGKLKAGDTSNWYSLNALRQAKFEEHPYYELYMYILTGKMQ